MRYESRVSEDAVVVVPRFTLRRPLSSESVAASEVPSSPSSVYSTSSQHRHRRASSSTSSGPTQNGAPAAGTTLRQRASFDARPRQHLRSSSSTSSLYSSAAGTRPLLYPARAVSALDGRQLPKRRSSAGSLRQGSASWSTPTLAQLVQDEHDQMVQKQNRLSFNGAAAGDPVKSKHSTQHSTPLGPSALDHPTWQALSAPQHTLDRHLESAAPSRQRRPPSRRHSGAGANNETADSAGTAHYSPYFDDAFTSAHAKESNDDWDTVWAQHQNERLVPESAILHPPLYGRPGPSPSPDIFTTLLQPILSLSRPSSPGVSPSLSAIDAAHSAVRSSMDADLSPLNTAEAPVDRSASSLPAHFPPRGAEDPAPTVESQGFVLYIGSLVAWIAFLVWSLCKDEWLVWLGIEWFPSREWALLVPAWTVMLVVFVYVSYLSINIFNTPDLDALNTLTDSAAHVLPISPNNDSNRSSRLTFSSGSSSVDGNTVDHPLLANSIYLDHDSVPTLHDLPIGIVNRVTFGDFRRKRGVGWGSKRLGKTGVELLNDREYLRASDSLYDDEDERDDVTTPVKNQRHSQQTL
ncbi:hypothetical protein OIV83_005059 [Microbotryomycetes sp. JL201]|nr:hypothetical protein OIV83_005059 [Microbotryomycetes sp. JL201]